MTNPIQRLREAHEAATPGPWVADVRIGVVQVYPGQFRNCLAAPSERVVMSKQGEWKDDHWTTDPQDEADAHAIVLAHNALPALLDIAEAARRYLAHVAEAATWTTPGVGCDGQCDEAAALLAALDRLEEGGS
jgi:hypothetical protein